MKKFLTFFLFFATFIFAQTNTEYELVKIGHNEFVIKKSHKTSKDSNIVSTTLDIPILNIHKRPDWIDVTKDVFPKAKGDGKTDDTAAIQAAFDLLKSNKLYSGVYFPEGTFLISDTLILGGNLYGKTLAGHGRRTVIKWIGPRNKPMLLSNGYAYSTFNGVTWDGNNKASIGVYHHSKTIFETFVEHKNEAFRNFLQAGIEAYGGGTEKYFATAEVYVYNCLFDNAHYALNIGTHMYNAYDWVIDRCEIRNGKIGIRAPKGQFFVYNTHFYNNSETDIHAQNGAYIRRVTSEKSYMFCKDTTFTTAGQLATFEDVHIDGWTNPKGIAIDYGFRGSMLLFNSSFTNSPKPTVSPVNIQGRNFSWTQHVTLSNNSFDGKAPLVDKTRAAVFLEIPPKTKETVIKSASTTFLDSSPKSEGPLIVVNGFNDAMAIQQAIDKAAKANNDSIVYMPAKDYYIDETIEVYGENYTIEGAGSSSLYQFIKGRKGNVFFHLKHANKVTMRSLRISLDHGEIGIMQDTEGNNIFDRLVTKGAWTNNDKTLLTLINLKSSIIKTIFNSGKFELVNFKGSLLAKTHLGKIFILGDCDNSFIGVRWLNGRSIYVNESNSITVGDFYTEQNEETIFEFHGGNTDKTGFAVIGGIRRAHSYNKQSPYYLLANNYKGHIVLMQGSFDNTVGNPIKFKVSSKNPGMTTLMLFGIGFYNKQCMAPSIYDIEIAQKETVYIEQSTVVIDGRRKTYDIKNTKLNTRGMTILQNAFERLFELGERDFKY